MKISILYFSATGTTQKAAEFIKEGCLSAGKMEVKLMNIADEANVDVDFVNASGAVLFGTPTYGANMCWQMKKFFDTFRKYELGGKIGAAFATENFVYGGADIALQGILEFMLVKGMLAYSAGGACGQPIIHLGPVALREELESKKDLFVLFGKRIGEKTLELFG